MTEVPDTFSPFPRLPPISSDVGHGLVRTLFLSLILFLVPNPNYIMLCYVILAECQRIGVHDDLARWGATNTSGRESTRGLYALKQKYHLPSNCGVP